MKFDLCFFAYGFSLLAQDKKHVIPLIEIPTTQIWDTKFQIRILDLRGPTRLKSSTLDSEIKPEIKKSREKLVNFEIRNH